MTAIYLGGPIDLSQVKIDLKEMLLNAFKFLNFQVVIFDPSKAFSIIDRNKMNVVGKYIELVNNMAIECSDLCIFAVPAGKQSFGVPLEIDLCRKVKKPFLIITNFNVDTSAYLSNRIVSKEHVFMTSFDDTTAMNAVIMEMASLIKNKVENKNG